jgi:3-polyprenyl-4-hydroxybenzoate decarboxylase
MDIVTAITGASGALYAQRFIQGLVAAGVRVHLVVWTTTIPSCRNDPLASLAPTSLYG